MENPILVIFNSLPAYQVGPRGREFGVKFLTIYTNILLNFSILIPSIFR